MNLPIDVYKDYVMIGTQRVDRPEGYPAGAWLGDWEAMKDSAGRVLHCQTCGQSVIR